jgi:hypothetical protein
MVELRQDLALQLEPGVHPGGEGAAVHNFDGDLLLELGIGPLSEVNLSHTAGTQGAQYPIRSYAVYHHFWSMHPGKGDLQTMAPLRAGISYVYESGAPKRPHLRRSTHMSNGHDPNKTPPPPPAPPSGPGGIKPQDVDKPPQSQLRALIG